MEKPRICVNEYSQMIRAFAGGEFMKIACIGYLHGTGGAERQIIMLANALVERGHEVHLIVLAANNEKYDICDDVIRHDLTFSENRQGNKIINRYLALKEALKTITPDVSIHYWFQSVYFCALMSKSITGKIIYSERGDPGDDEYSGLVGIVRKCAFTRVDGFVFQSEGAKDYFGKRIQSRSIVIHNSVDIHESRYFEPCKDRGKKIVNVGRLHPQKNQKLLVEAFARIADQIPEYTLEIYGDGDLEETLRKQISDLELENRVFLRGTTKEILEQVYTASLFVLSSDYEGLPNALMEALAIGVPCISTDCKPGGARTLIQDGINGWITPVGDAGALSQRILEVIGKGICNISLKEEAAKFRELHSSKKVFDMWEGYIRMLF